MNSLRQCTMIYILMCVLSQPSLKIQGDKGQNAQDLTSNHRVKWVFSYFLLVEIEMNLVVPSVVSG